MTTRSSTLAWKIVWTVEPGRLQSEGHKESDTTEHLHTYICLFPTKLIIHSLSRKQTKKKELGREPLPSDISLLSLRLMLGWLVMSDSFVTSWTIA